MRKSDADIFLKKIELFYCRNVFSVRFVIVC